MGVSGVVVVLIAAAAVIVISVTVCLKKRKSKHINTVTAHGVSETEMELSTDTVYTANSCDSTFMDSFTCTYEYVDINTSVITTPNMRTSDAIPQDYEPVEHYYD